MFQQLLVNKHHRLCDSKFGREEVWVWSTTTTKKNKKQTKNKPQIEHEPRSAHGCAVNNALSNFTHLLIPFSS